MEVSYRTDIDRVGSSETEPLRVLPLDKSFVMMKFKLDKGHISASSSGFWSLETEIDQSIMVVYGYQVVAGDIKPFTRDQAVQLGDAAMPDLGKESQPTVAIGQEKDVLLSPLRILACFSVTCCKSATTSNRVVC